MYSTFITGKDAYMDRALLAGFGRDLTTALWRLGWTYQSNWRILHIDGFEYGTAIPERKDELRFFFSYGVQKPNGQ